MPESQPPHIEEIIDSLFAAIPIIHRKLINSLEEGIGLGISHHHFAVLGMISRLGALPVSEIGKRLWISKPQMTAVIDKLVDLGLVARQQHETDRRVIFISLTPSGRAVLNKGRKALHAGLSEKLADLTEEDLGTLSAALKKINEIGSKIK
jgi:MarR family 2-MHQ and catechol resistance regulon transcriptional repressor